MPNRSRAKRLASSPPAAPRISTMTLRPSLGSGGSSSTRSSSVAAVTAASSSSIISRSSAPLARIGVGVHPAGFVAVVDRGPQPVPRGHDLAQLLVAAAQLGQAALVGLHRGVAEADLHVSQLDLEAGYPLQHGFEATAGLRPPKRSTSPPMPTNFNGFATCGVANCLMFDVNGAGGSRERPGRRRPQPRSRRRIDGLGSWRWPSSQWTVTARPGWRRYGPRTPRACRRDPGRRSRTTRAHRFRRSAPPAAGRACPAGAAGS